MNRAGKVLSYELVYRVSFDVQGPDGKGAPAPPGDRTGARLLRPGDPDTVLLIVAPKLDRKDLKTKWVQEVDRLGGLVQVWPREGQRLVGWLEERLRGAAFHPDPAVAALLAARVEGNLLAAVQEVEKLRLLRDPGPLDEAGLLAAVCDNARFDLFDLTDAALSGDLARVARVVAGLAGEGTAPPLMLWVLPRGTADTRTRGLRKRAGPGPGPGPGGAAGPGVAPDEHTARPQAHAAERFARPATLLCRRRPCHQGSVS